MRRGRGSRFLGVIGEFFLLLFIFFLFFFLISAGGMMIRRGIKEIEANNKPTESFVV